MVAFTVQIDCGSGMQSIDTAYRYIREGVSDLVLAGGAELLSHAPLMFSRRAVNWYARLFAAHGIGAQACDAPGLASVVLHARDRPRARLTDPITDLNMGQTAELVGHLFHITRRQADEYAAESRQRWPPRRRTVISPARSSRPSPVTATVRSRRRREARQLRRRAGQAEACVRAPWGKVTPGNSRANHRRRIMGHSRVRRCGEGAQAQPKAVIVDSEWSALDPSVMGLGPVYCSSAILKRHQLGLNDIELWELNEAFAAQVLGCLAAWEDDEFCRDALGLSSAGRKNSP